MEKQPAPHAGPSTRASSLASTIDDCLFLFAIRLLMSYKATVCEGEHNEGRCFREGFADLMLKRPLIIRLRSRSDLDDPNLLALRFCSKRMKGVLILGLCAVTCLLGCRCG